MSAKPSLTLKRRLKAPPAKVFAAWTDPKMMIHWWSPVEFETLICESDPTVGGRFRVLMRGPDGTEHDVSGRFREVVRNERLVFSWAWKTAPEQVSQVTITLKPDGAGTLLTLLHEQLPDAPTRDSHNTGWSGALDKLERLVA
jgi:uncharacterized protein YndB with AHSA1/START domain